jgi:uncharacterized membrane protein YkvA (DUF1232 family)
VKVLSNDFVTYYDYLKTELNKYRDSFDDYIFNLPELFKLMCNLLNSNIEVDDRGNIAKALGYFVAPTDVIFEEVYGPMGFIDDLYLCCYVLAEIKNKYGMELLEKHWDSGHDLEKMLNDCYTKSSDFIKDESLKQYILKYVGLI